MKSVYVKDLQPGQRVRDLFAVCAAKLGTSKNGPYWSLTLQDRTGRLEAKIWSPHSQAHPDIPAGCFALVEGQAGLFREQVQLVVERFLPVALLGDDGFVPLGGPPDGSGQGDGDGSPERPADYFVAEPGLDLSDFLPVSARRPEEMLAALELLHKERLRHAPWRKLCRGVLADEEIRRRLLAAPGAKAIHHAYAGGLLEHTLSVCELCLDFCRRYPRLDPEILLAAASFHDLGKAWELTLGLVRDYTDEGRLLGHIQIVLELLGPHLKRSGLAPEQVAHFKHIILSHHGEYAYGSPKRPKTAEAMALHYADNLDAKMQTVAEAFADAGEAEGVWSPYQRSLERFLFKPKATPPTGPRELRPAVGGEAKPGSEQCSLPLKG